MVARSQPVAIPLRRRPGFHVVIGPKHRKAGGWVVLSLAVAAVFFLMISARIALDKTAFVLEDVQRQISVEEARYWDLRLQVAELQSPERVARLAEESGMVYPVEISRIEVPGLGEPGPGIEDRWVDLKALLGAQP
jgi:cell division protein FtsL